MHRKHIERHRTQSLGWLRAAVLGANDGIVSIGCLIVGVASSSTAHSGVVLAGVAGLTAGAMSMAAGEYVSVSSQKDSEQADIAREKRELVADRANEEAELTAIYIQRGLDARLAREVALTLMKKDALAAHLRDELGISSVMRPRPLQAALASALSFSAGAVLPLLCAWLTSGRNLIWAVSLTSLILLCALGGVGAYMGGARIARGVIRVAFWGALAMAVTAVTGFLVGAG